MVLGAVGLAGTPARPEAPPNVVLVLFDDLGVGELQWYPERERIEAEHADAADAIQTPHLFALAREGLRCTSFYANGPVCSPTRAAILTGLYPQRFGLRRAYDPEGGRGLPDVPTLATRLGERGYRTAHFGKWHLGSALAEYLPVNRGFHESLTLHVPDGAGYRGGEWIRGDDLAHPFVDGERHSAETITNAALEFVEDHHAERGGEPFFLNVWYRTPHVPLDPPARFPGAPARVAPKSDWARTWNELAAAAPGLEDHGYQEHDANARAKERALYAASLAFVDHQIGRLVRRVDALWPARRTLVLVTSDNGPDPKPFARAEEGSPPGWKPKGSLRGAKASVFEGGLRVPLIVRWPEHVPAGGRFDGVGATFDLMPTLLELAGARPDEVRALGLDGVSLRDAWLEGRAFERGAPLVFETKGAATRFEPPAEGALADELNRYAVRDDALGRKLVVSTATPGENGPRLFDLARTRTHGLDESDAADLARAEPQTVERLEGVYRAWRQEVGRVHVPELGEGTSVPIPGPVVEVAARGDLLVRDGDFSFEVGLRFEELPTQPLVFARHPGSWALGLVPRGEPGRYELGLELVGKDPTDPGHPGRPGAVLHLVGEVELRASVPFHAAFTVFGWRFSESDVRLFADGRALAAYPGEDGAAIPRLPELFASAQPVRLGGPIAGGGRGELREPRFHRIALTEREVRAAAGRERRPAGSRRGATPTPAWLLVLPVVIVLLWRRRRRRSATTAR